MVALLYTIAGLTTALVLTLAWTSWRIWYRLKMRPLSLVLALFLLLTTAVAWWGLLGSVSGFFGLGIWWGSLTVLAAVDGCFLATLLAMKLYALAHRQAPDTGYLLVLGAYLLGGTQVGPVLASRIQAALQAASHYQNRATIVFSGGQGFDERLPEGVAMRDFVLSTSNYPAEQLLVEDRSHNTYQNLVYTRALLAKRGVTVSADQPLLIFTSDYHVLRAALLAKRIGLPAKAYGGPTGFLVGWRGRLREFLALLNTYRRPVIAFIGLSYLLAFLVSGILLS